MAAAVDTTVQASQLEYNIIHQQRREGGPTMYVSKNTTIVHVYMYRFIVYV